MGIRTIELLATSQGTDASSYELVSVPFFCEQLRTTRTSRFAPCVAMSTPPFPLYARRPPGASAWRRHYSPHHPGPTPRRARHLTDRLTRGKNFSPPVPLSRAWHITDRMTLRFRGAPLPLDALTKWLRGRPVQLTVPSATHSLGLSVNLA